MGSYVTKKRTRPFDYPAGTRVTTRSDWLPCKIAELDLEWTGIAVQRALALWQRDHERDLDLEEMFITVAFSHGFIHIEVSDRMRAE